MLHAIVDDDRCVFGHPRQTSAVGKVVFFPCGNGDTVLIVAPDGTRVITDLCYGAFNGTFGNPQLKLQLAQFVPDHHVDVFVLSHPDPAHIKGFGQVFHVGDPEAWTSQSDRIVADEIWCSPGAASVAPADWAEPRFFEEVGRRMQLRGTAAAAFRGNRLRLVDAESTEGVVGPRLSYEVFAPAPAGKRREDGCEIASGDFDRMSLVTRWAIRVDTRVHHILLGGDAPVETWEWIYDSLRTTGREVPAWDVLLAPHHCSRRPVGRAYRPQGRVTRDGYRDTEYLPSRKAELVLSGAKPSAWIVASCQKSAIIRHDPPSAFAREFYLSLLARAPNDRLSALRHFAETNNHPVFGGPVPLVFTLTEAGVTLGDYTDGPRARASTTPVPV